jgi:hypothetical protein
MEEGERQGGAVVCAEHGLRYDPAQHKGCVICRRTAPAAPPSTSAVTSEGEPASASTIARVVERAREKPAIAIAAGVGALVIVVGIAALAARGSGAPTPSASAAAEGSPAAEIAKYLHTVDTFDRALPVEEARAALSGMGEEARRGSLDVEARRRAIQSYAAKLEAQKQAFTALPVPPAASTHHDIVVEQYERLTAFVEVALEELRIHEEVAHLLERKKTISTRDEAVDLQGEFRAMQDHLNTTLEKNRRIEADERNLAERRSAEEARLASEYRLPAAGAGNAKKAAPAAPPEDEALLRQPFCRSILEMGGTIAECKAARAPDNPR